MVGKNRRPGREAWLMLYFPVYLLLFYAVEHTVSATSNYWVSWCVVDTWIPFVRQFVLAYVLWYPLMLGMALWLLFRDERAFVRFAWCTILNLTLSILIFFIFPNGQNLRPAAVEGGDLTAWMLRMIYAADTNTNVLPSMHVAGTLAAMRAAFDTDSLGRPARWALALVGVLINASTVLIKQHSVLDIAAGIALFALVEPLVYRLPRRLRARRRRSAR